MACPEYEFRVCAYVEGELEGAERECVANHLAACAACRAFAAQLGELDRALTQAVGTPALAPDFDARLWHRIESDPLLASSAARAARKRELQAEFDTRMRELGRKSAWFVILLDGLAYGAFAAMLLYALYRFVPETISLRSIPSVALSQNLPVAMAAGALVLFAGLGIAFGRPVMRWWRAA